MSNLPKSSTFGWLTIAALTIGTCACQPKAKSLNLAEKEYMDSLTSTSKTRCVGRFLIDIPAPFVLDPSGGQDVDGVTLVVMRMSEGRFREILSAKKSRLENKLLPGEEKFPFLRSATALSGDVPGTLFDRAESDVASSRMGRVLEAMVWRSGYSITGSIDAIDTDFPEFANDAWIKESKTTTKEKQETLLQVIARTRGRNEEEVPTEKGLCIVNGFVAGQLSAAENVTMIYNLKSATDVFFTLNTSRPQGHSDSLMDRGRRAKEVIEIGSGSILRSGKNENKGVTDGEELLYKILGDPDAERKQIMTYKFAFEANTETGNAIGGALGVELDVGEVRSTSSNDEVVSTPLKAATLSESEAIALWDAVIPTIRPRTGAF